jgi:hypothetical protein
VRARIPALLPVLLSASIIKALARR